MTLPSAIALWGADVVQRALREGAPEVPTPELLAEIRTHATDPHELARWALEQPWARFCAVVRIAAGETRRELTGGDNDG